VSRQGSLAAETLDVPLTLRQPSWWQRKSNRRLVNAAVIYVLILPRAFVFLIPLLWLLSTAFKESTQIFAHPPTWIPDPI